MWAWRLPASQGFFEDPQHLRAWSPPPQLRIKCSGSHPMDGTVLYRRVRGRRQGKVQGGAEVRQQKEKGGVCGTADR